MAGWADVVVTGYGVVSPIGIGVEAFWDSLVAGRSGVGPLTRLNTATLPVHFGAEVSDFEPKRFIRPIKSLKVMSRDIQLGVAAAGMALTQAGIGAQSVDPERFGVVFGADSLPCDPEDVAAAYRACLQSGRFSLDEWGGQGLAEIYPLWMLKYLPNMPACHIAIAHDARGPNNTITLGEVSSLMAVAEAAHTIARGGADVMVCGGAGSRLQPVNFVRGFVGELSRRNDEPGAACRPFDLHRDGSVIGEGAAAFVLEHRRHAAARGARPLARLVSFGAAQAPRPRDEASLRGAVQAAIDSALRSAGWRAHDVGHASAHGMSTKLDDRAEAQAIAGCLGRVAVTAPKSAFGYLGAGSGAVELLAAMLSCRHGLIPATLNYQAPDPACPVQVVSGGAHETGRRTALKLSHAATGQATALALAAE